MGRRRKITAEYIASLIAAGYGSGHGENYQPFMRIEWGNTSPVSNQKNGMMPALVRRGQFFARQEDRIANLCYWLGAKDVREQFPMWPMPHQHPGVGLPEFEHLRGVPCDGLLKIAQSKNIAHGFYPGTRVHYIGTLDLLVTVRRNRRAELAAIAVKLREDVQEAAPTARLRERLVLGQHYSRSIGLPHRIADMQVMTPTINKNMNSYAPHIEAARLVRSHEGLVGRALALFQNEISSLSKRELEAKAAKDLGISKDLAQRAFKYLAWHSSLDIDFTQEIYEDYPVPCGAQQIKRALQVNLFGGEIDE